MSVNPLLTPSGCSGIFAVPDLMDMLLGTEAIFSHVYHQQSILNLSHLKQNIYTSFYLLSDS